MSALLDVGRKNKTKQCLSSIAQCIATICHVATEKQRNGAVTQFVADVKGGKVST